MWVGMMSGCSVGWVSSRSWDEHTLISCRISSRQGIWMERQRAENGGGAYGWRIVIGGGLLEAMILVAYAYRGRQKVEPRRWTVAAS